VKPRATTSRQRGLLVLATLAAGVLGLAVGGAALVGLMMAESGLYEAPSPLWGLVAGLLAGAITAAPLAFWWKSWPTVAVSALAGAVLGALSIVLP
jgi:hypothetical protein